MNFTKHKSDSKLSKKLEKVSETLDKKEEVFYRKNSRNFETEKGSNAGAKEMTIEQVVRITNIKTPAPAISPPR